MQKYNFDFYEAWDALEIPAKQVSAEVEKEGERIMQRLPKTRQQLISACDWQLLTKKENNDHGIYIIRNRETGQLYIGKAKSFNERRNDHFLAKRRDSKILHNAIRADRNHGLTDDEIGKKYLWARIYTDFKNDEDLRCYLEKRCIEYYNTLRGADGSNDYNATAGGYGGSGIKLAPEIYNEIAHAYHNGKTELQIIDWLTNEYGDELRDEYGEPLLKEGSIVRDVWAKPETYKKYIKDYEKITFTDADGKIRFRPKIDLRKEFSVYSDAQYKHFIKAFDSKGEAAQWIAELQFDKYSKTGKCDFKLMQFPKWKADHNYKFSIEDFYNAAYKNIGKYAKGEHAGRPYLGYYWR